jgi:hypothetical protein
MGKGKRTGDDEKEKKREREREKERRRTPRSLEVLWWWDWWVGPSLLSVEVFSSSSSSPFR